MSALAFDPGARLVAIILAATVTATVGMMLEPFQSSRAEASPAMSSPRHGAGDSDASGTVSSSPSTKTSNTEPARADAPPETGTAAVSTPRKPLAGLPPAPTILPTALAATPPSAAAADVADPPLVERWWFWTAIAAVAVTTIVIAAAASGPNTPKSDLGTMAVF